jgi:hypothetical protein
MIFQNHTRSTFIGVPRLTAWKTAMTRTYLLLGSALALLFCFSANALAFELSGRYSSSGSNPGGKGGYSGHATISRRGDLYQIVWKVGSTYTGTGILTDNVLSVAYTDAKNQWFGVVSYRVLDFGNKLQGVWTSHGGRQLGTELLVRQ